MKIKHFLYGFAIGGLAAGISTLLSAPKSGKETRAALKENTDLWKEQLADLKNSLIELKDASMNASKEARIHTSNFLRETQTSITNWKADILPHQDELKQEITEIETTIQQLEANLSDQTKI
ncbi:YtxH domain-containing protein [Neobacillus sp. PS3-34]|uniref:YtxH domain-containing protein n=1 Tax=Neobacillus sp. PS3-34 TaxID=3070678 RepID=UPI0027E1EE68|nr:YtxH domain-containing protein [Neobacillus sp. PS3-34]WML49651.1 YtxH domain-containing protein [Neobacillus sp. PS3-34]